MAKSQGMFGGVVKLQGESEYSSALKNIANNLKVTSSELKLSSTEFKNNGEKVGDLRTQNDALNNKLKEELNIVKICSDAIKDFTNQQKNNEDVINKLKNSLEIETKSLKEMENSTSTSNEEISKQAQIVANLKNELQKAQSTYDANNKKINDYTNQMNNAKIECSNLTKNINDNNDILNKAGTSTKNMEKSVKDFAEGEDKASESGLKLGNIIKGNLISDAIKSGLKSLANSIAEIPSSFNNAMRSGASYADDLNTLSTQTGISTEALQKYEAVSQLVDVSTDTLTSSMAKNIKQMSSNSEAYGKLGVSIRDANGNLRDSEDVYWESINALGQIQNETERDALAMSLFGKSAQDLNPLIALGSEGIEELNQKAENMGAVLSQDALNSLNDLNNELDIFASTSKATGNIIASGFSSSISKVMGEVNNLGGSFNHLISAVLSGDEGGIEDATAQFSENVENLVSSISEKIPKMMEIANNLISTLINVISENLPQILDMGLQLITTLLNGISENLGEILPVIVNVIMGIVNAVVQNLPTIIQAGIQVLLSLIQGIAQSLPTLVPTIVDALLTIVDAVLENIDLIIDAGIEIIFGLIDGLINALPDLIDKIPEIIDKLITAITENLPKIIEAGITLTIKIAEGLIKAIPQLVSKIPQIITSIITGIKNNFGKMVSIGGDLLGKVRDGIVNSISKMGDVGKNLVQGLWNGISNAKNWVLDKIKGFGKSILDGIKGFFGIHSPSTLFEDEVGVNLALGIGEGFSDEIDDVNKQIKESIPTDYDLAVNTTLTKTGSLQNQMYSQQQMFTNALKDALEGMNVVMDGDKIGKIIVSNIEEVVYS